MRVAVVGAGAMGSLISYLLRGAGTELVVYEKRESRVADIGANGIRLRGAIDGRFYPQLGVPGEPVPSFDVIVLAVAAVEGGEALRPLSPFVHRRTVYLSLQDGNAVDELAGLVGKERTGGAIPLASAVESPSGEVEVEELRCIRVGAFHPEGREAFSLLVEAMEAGMARSAELVSDLESEVWARLQAAAAVSGLCGVLGAAPEEIKGMEGVDDLCREAAAECAALATSQGLETPAINSPWQEAVWRWIKPPLLMDLERGRKTEVEFLCGPIARRAGGIRAPVHSAIYSLLKEMESGNRRPGEESFKELKRRVREERGMSLQ
jgi:2-dehydropantoate 2-reductase